MSDFGKTDSKAEHRRIREMLSVYIDGELPSGDQARVEEHLAGCADCTWELETLRQIVDLMGQLPKVPVPRAFTIHETSPQRISLSQARWTYTYLKGATALVTALLILVLAGDALFQFQRVTTSFVPAKELAAPAAALTVVARQEVPPAPKAPSLPEEGVDEAEGAAYAGATPSPLPVEETQAKGGDQYKVPMPPPTTPTLMDYGLAASDGATAAPLATSTPPVGRGGNTDTALPSAAMEVPAEGAAQAPMLSAAAPTAMPQPQMTATPIPAAPLAPVSAAPAATPTPTAVATATATATPVPAATPVGMAKAPAEARPTEESALAGRQARLQEPRLTLLRVIEVSLCLLVIALIAATLIVRRRNKTSGDRNHE